MKNETVKNETQKNENETQKNGNETGDDKNVTRNESFGEDNNKTDQSNISI